MALYKTYLFKDKDPVIDLLRTAMQLEADARGIKFSAVMRKIALESGVALGTLYNWFFGATKAPKYCCVAAVANAVQAHFYVGTRSATRQRRAA